ncbi:hypothetical protein D3C74_91070 [compost metagenome]
MKRKFEVEMTITKTYDVKVIVEGEFSGVDDPDIEEVAKQQADNMSHDSWSYKDSEYEVTYVDKVD